MCHNSNKLACVLLGLSSSWHFFSWVWLVSFLIGVRFCVVTQRFFRLMLVIRVRFWIVIRRFLGLCCWLAHGLGWLPTQFACVVFRLVLAYGLGDLIPIWLACFAGFISSQLACLGGVMTSWIVHSPPDRAVRVRALAGDIVLCSWARHFTFSVPLSNKVYSWG